MLKRTVRPRSQERPAPRGVSRYKRRPLLVALAGDSVASTRPVREWLERLITPQVLDRVAEAWLHEGRRLAIIAVDMDCGKPELLDAGRVILAGGDRFAATVRTEAGDPASPLRALL